MLKETISGKQGISIIFMFTLGSSLVIGGSNEAMQDSWIAMLCGYLAALPFIFIYARIVKLHPEKDLFDIITDLFGNILGKIIALLFTWYALHLGGLVLRNFAEFIEVSAMVETPKIAILIFMGILCIYAVKSGIETFGKWSLILMPILVFVVLLTIALAAKDYKYGNLLPVFVENMDKIPISAFSNFTFPFTETVLAISVISSIKKQDSPYRVYFLGISAAAFFLVLGILRNILLLGIPYLNSVYYPSYSAVKHIIVGQFFSRIEGTIGANFLFAGSIKVCVCLFAASKGLAKLLNVEDYKRMVVPAALIMFMIGLMVYDNAMEMFEWINVYRYYALPFEVLLPVIMLITAEIKSRKSRRSKTA